MYTVDLLCPHALRGGTWTRSVPPVVLCLHVLGANSFAHGLHARLSGLQHVRVSTCFQPVWSLTPSLGLALLAPAPACRKHQYTSITDWTGGLYISPGFAGSRSGALIATAWAALVHLGEEGYLQATGGAGRGKGPARRGRGVCVGVCSGGGVGGVWVGGA